MSEVTINSNSCQMQLLGGGLLYAFNKTEDVTAMYPDQKGGDDIIFKQRQCRRFFSVLNHYLIIQHMKSHPEEPHLA